MINPFLARRLFEFSVRPVLVEVQPDALTSVLDSFFRGGLGIRNIIKTFSMVGVLPIPSKLIPAIDALPGVRAVHADLEVNAIITPLAPDQTLWYPTSESRKMLEAELAFEQGWTGEAVRLGVVDTGIEPMHPQLVGSEWESVITLPVREVLDENGHGSHVSSTAAGKLVYSDLGVFTEGVSRALIHSVKALGRGIGTGFTSEVINAMALLMERGATVVNLSLGSQACQGGCDVCPQCRAVKRLTDSGILVAVAAGNSGPDPDTIGCPGCSPAAITVAAVDREGRVADFSSRGGSEFPNKPDVAAPGVDIYSGTARGSFIDAGEPGAGFGYAAISGTSMATPHIAGLLSLLKHRNPALTERQFKEVIRSQGTAFDHEVGYGVPKWSWFRAQAARREA